MFQIRVFECITQVIYFSGWIAYEIGFELKCEIYGCCDVMGLGQWDII